VTWRAWLLGLLVLSPAVAASGEPEGFRDRPWGSPWQFDTISSLPGCDTQGEVVADVEGVIGRVIQPECVGYRFSNEQTVNLILLYPEIKWHRLEDSRTVVRTLLAHPKVWGLDPAAVDRLETARASLDRLERLRGLYGAEAPIFPDSGHLLAGSGVLGGLQGYQLNFQEGGYAAMRASALSRLGQPTRQSSRWVSSSDGDLVTSEVLEWSGERTLAVLKEHGLTGPGGFLAVVTRAYHSTLGECAPAGRRPDHAVSYPWFMGVIEGFGWAR
jgi:hypothetical protein